MLLILSLSILILGCGVYSWMAGLEGWYSPLFLVGTAVFCVQGLLSLI